MGLESFWVTDALLAAILRAAFPLRPCTISSRTVQGEEWEGKRYPGSRYTCFFISCFVTKPSLPAFQSRNSQLQRLTSDMTCAESVPNHCLPVSYFPPPLPHRGTTTNV